jgi:hypothetical protein
MGVNKDISEPNSHKSPEEFLKNIIIGSNIFTALLAFMLSTLLLTFIDVLGIYHSFEAFLVALESEGVVLNTVIGELPKIAVLLLAYPLCVWVMGNFYFKKPWKVGLAKTFTAMLIPVIFSLLLVYLAMLIALPDFWILDGLTNLVAVLLLLSAFPLFFVGALISLKIISRDLCTIVDALLVYFVVGCAMTLSFMIVGGIWASFYHHNNPTEAHLIPTVFNHSDGSFTVQYDYATSFEGEVYFRQICNITYPTGWHVPTMEEYLNGYGKNWTVYEDAPDTVKYKIIYKESMWNTSRPEYVYFYDIPPMLIRRLGISEENYEPGERVLFGDIHYTTVNCTISHDKDAGINTQDCYFISEDGAYVVHTAYMEFPSLLAVWFDYYAPYGQDDDFYYILNSTTCYVE